MSRIKLKGLAIGVMFLILLASDASTAFTRKDAEEAQKVVERIGKVYVDANDILKIAKEIDPATRLPYADLISLLVLALKAERYLEEGAYGKLLSESAWFVGKKAVVDSYSFAAPFLMLGDLYYSLFKKIAGIPRHFEDQFFKFQINKYMSLRTAYDANSVREFALDSPLGLADDRVKGYFFVAGLGGSTSTQVNLALRLRDNGFTPEVIFELGEKLWDLQQRLPSLAQDRSIQGLVERIKEATGPKTKGISAARAPATPEKPTSPVEAIRGRFCSVRSDDGVWALGGGASGGQCERPMTYCRQKGGKNCSVVSSGQFHLHRENTVQARCTGSSRDFHGVGEAPLREALSWAQSSTLRGCVFSIKGEESVDVVQAPLAQGSEVKSARETTPEPSAVGASAQITTTDGSMVRGKISGGSLTMKTAFGELKIDGRRVQAFSGSTLTLDDGSTIKGNIVGGSLQVTSAHGTLTIPGQKIQTIRGTQQAKATVQEGKKKAVRGEIPQPEFYGVYVVSHGELIGIQNSPIIVPGASMRITAGLKNLSGVTIDDPNAYIVIYQPDVREMVLRLQLSKLQFGRFRARATLVTPEEVVEMWVHDRQVPVNVKPATSSPDLYAVVPAEPLTAGAYALHQGILTAKSIFELPVGEDEVLNFRVGHTTPTTAPSESPPISTPRPSVTEVRFVNETQRTLHVYLDGRKSYTPLGPNESFSRRLSVGSHHVKVQVVTSLGPLVFGQGAGFEKSIQMEPNAVIRFTESDFR